MFTDLFTKEHQLFRQSVKDYIEREVLEHVDQWEEDFAIPKELFHELGSMGYLGLGISEEWDGEEGDLFHIIALTEELAKCGALGISTSVLTHSFLVTRAIYLYGSDHLKKEYLPDCINGSRVGCFAVNEAECGGDLEKMTGVAERQEKSYRLTATKPFVVNGRCADFIVVAANLEGEGPSLFVVNTPFLRGLDSDFLPTMGQRTAMVSNLTMDQICIPERNLLGEAGKGLEYIEELLTQYRLLMATQTLALSERALSIATEYAKQRHAFGKPIGTFHGVNEKLAKMKGKTDMLRSLLYNVARSMQANEACSTNVALLKWFSGEWGYEIAYDAIQVHGGYGCMEEYPVARIYRDIQLNKLLWGTSETMKDLVVHGMGLV